MRAFKSENVVIKESDESKIKELLARGFKEIGEDGKLIEDEKQTVVSPDEFDTLKQEKGQLEKENAELKKKLAEANKKLKEATQQSG
ncbi:hypothetical protein ABDI30_11950 [Paenibacillus cisolokensis]|uniref:hypothetical protein n=1 Tax=Paenibacillus cisolokensis TaxID=1658519 RepID=UPI003D2B8AAD